MKPEDQSLPPKEFSINVSQEEELKLDLQTIGLISEQQQFHCQLASGASCGVGVQLYLKNTDPSHAYNVTLSLYTNGSYIQQSTHYMASGGLTYLSCSKNGLYSYVYYITGEQVGN